MNLMNIDTPIMKSFIYNGGYYVYDTATNRLFCVSEADYIELNKLQKCGIEKYIKSADITNETQSNIIVLLEKGMFQKSIVEHVCHAETEYTKYLTNRCITDMTLQVTNNCNMCCRYCAFSCNSVMNRDHEKISMAWDTAKKCIDFLFYHSVNANEVTISFYGGEPLLDYELIFKCVKYAERTFSSKRVNYVMTTNATVINDKIIDFLAEYKFLLTISFDGPKTVHNYHRKFLLNGNDTYNVVYSNVKRMVKRQPSYFRECVLINPVIFDDENSEIVYDYFFREFQIEKERVTLRRATMSGIDYIEKKIDQLHTVQPSYMSEEFPEDIKKDLDRTFCERSVIPRKWQHNGPCVPGVKMIFADVDGRFFPCEKCPEENYFIIGNVERGIDISKTLCLMNFEQELNNQCKTCWAMRYCNMCAIRCYDSEKKCITDERLAVACKEEAEKTLQYFRQIIDHKKEVNNSHV